MLELPFLTGCGQVLRHSFCSLQTPVSWHEAEAGRAAAHRRSASWSSMDHRREVRGSHLAILYPATRSAKEIKLPAHTLCASTCAVDPRNLESVSNTTCGKLDWPFNAEATFPLPCALPVQYISPVVGTVPGLHCKHANESESQMGNKKNYDLFSIAGAFSRLHHIVCGW